MRNVTSYVTSPLLLCVSPAAIDRVSSAFSAFAFKSSTFFSKSATLALLILPVANFWSACSSASASFAALAAFSAVTAATAGSTYTLSIRSMSLSPLFFENHAFDSKFHSLSSLGRVTFTDARYLSQRRDTRVSTICYKNMSARIFGVGAKRDGNVAGSTPEVIQKTHQSAPSPQLSCRIRSRSRSPRSRASISNTSS